MVKHLFLIIALFLAGSLNAQVTLKGKISCQGKDVPFVNITLYQGGDTTKLAAGTVTDTQGDYVFNGLAKGRYKLVVSGVGYTTFRDFLTLDKATVVVKDVRINENTVALNEVVVKANRKTNYVDKSVYTFSEQQMKAARYANDLLTTLSTLSIDPSTHKIIKFGGGEVKILINGVNATDNDLKSITPDKVLKVEYYDIPPARYATVGALVNVITKKLDTGYNGGFDLGHAFTTGFGNDNAYFKYVTGHNQFSFDYELHYRDYDHYILNAQYSFNLSNKDWRYNIDTQGHFGYTTNDINFKFTRHIEDKYTFQATFSPNFQTYFNHYTGNILHVSGPTGSVLDSNTSGINQETRLGKSNVNTNTFGPVLDLYYSKNFVNHQELSVNVVGTLYHNSEKKNNKETENSTGEVKLFDDMMQRNDKQSIIAELAYTKSFGVNTLSLGYRGTYAHSVATIRNFLSNGETYDSGSHNGDQYIYSELAGSKNKLMYRIGLGGTIVYTKNSDAHHTSYQFTPKGILGYKIDNHQEVRLVLQSSPIEPTISQLSNNIELITENIVRRGNPYLQSGHNYTTSFYYNLNNAYLDMQVGGLMSYDFHPINTYYLQDSIEGQPYIVSTNENARKFLQTGAYTNVSFRPFKTNLIVLKWNAYILRQKLTSDLIGTYSYWYHPMDFEIDLQKGEWGGVCQWNIVSNKINGAYLSADENEAYVQVYWQHKNLRLFSECYWPFTKSKYHVQTLPNKVMTYDNRHHIDDNKSMFSVGLSWSFSKGKKLNASRNLQNRDTDRGMF